MFTWSRYRKFWAVWRGATLICVTVYRRGAVEATRLLNASESAGLRETSHVCDDDCRSYGCKTRRGGS